MVFKMKKSKDERGTKGKIKNKKILKEKKGKSEERGYNKKTWRIKRIR